MGKINLGGVKVPEYVPTARSFTPSPQQEEIFRRYRESRDNLTIEAVAGAGKTTTLVELARLVASNGAFLAFNRAIADEIGRKLAAAGISEGQVAAKTFHSVGLRAWKGMAPKARTDANKMDVVMEQIRVPKALRAFVAKACSIAKQSLFGVLCDMEDDEPWLEIIDHFDLKDMLAEDDGGDRWKRKPADDASIDTALAWCLQALTRSNELGLEIIDFDDMIYLPVLRRALFHKYAVVFVDEAQDTNAARREMVRRILAPGGRVVAVGDRHQAIYGFTGADSDALDLITREFSCVELPLTVTYRCPKAVVAHARQLVSHIEAAPSAPEGAVVELELPLFQALTPGAEDAILCRNMKPLVELAFGYMKRRIPCHVEGRELGQGLIALTKKWRGATTIEELRSKLDEFLEKERARADENPKKAAKLGATEDKVETLFVLMTNFQDDDGLEPLRNLISSMFQDGVRNLTLATIHKAKGREWDNVFLYGRNQYMPSPYAKQPWQQEQEKNLAYVAITRAKATLYEVILPAKRR